MGSRLNARLTPTWKLGRYTGKSRGLHQRARLDSAAFCYSCSRLLQGEIHDESC
jgi:hypothetical protein